jgi:hypothetical protein
LCLGDESFQLLDVLKNFDGLDSLDWQFAGDDDFGFDQQRAIYLKLESRMVPIANSRQGTASRGSRMASKRPRFSTSVAFSFCAQAATCC